MSEIKIRRKFLRKLAAFGGAGAAVGLAGCGVGSNSQNNQSTTQSSANDYPEINLKFQGGFPAKDPLFDIALDVYGFIEKLSEGKIKVELLPSGAVVGALDQADAVHKGVLDGSHAVPAYWYGKNVALSLFGTGPCFGHDANTVLAWMEYGGGRELYEKMYSEVLGLDVYPVTYGAMPTQPLGWFKKEIKNADQFKGLKYRTVGLAIDVFKNMGASVVALPGGEIIPALERGVIDAAEFNNPASDLSLGFPDVAKVCMVKSYHQPSEFFEILINKKKWEEMPEHYRNIFKIAAKAASAQMSWKTLNNYSEKFVQMRDEMGVKFVETPKDVLKAQLNAWDKIVEERTKDNEFFGEIIESQKTFMKRVVDYQTTFIADSKLAFDHYFK